MVGGPGVAMFIAELKCLEDEVFENVFRRLSVVLSGLQDLQFM